MPATVLRSALDRSPTQFGRSLILKGILEVYKKYGVGITPRQFGKSWTRMNPRELQTALHLIGTIQAQSPRGAGWVTTQISRRVAVTTFDGAIWSAAIGFHSRTEAVTFLQWLAGRQLAVLTSEPRKGKRSGCPVEVKLWSPANAFLQSLVEKDAA